MQAVLFAKTLIVAHTSLQAVVKRTGWTPSAIETFFEWPFCSMTRVENYKSLPVTEVPFNGVGKVLIHDDIMMGIYVSPHREKIPPYLLAYSMRSQELEWGLPLDLKTEKTHLGRLGELVTLFIEDDFVVKILDPKTGMLVADVHLPIKRNTKCLQVCFVERGWCFMRLQDETGRYKVVAGPLVDGKLHPQQEWNQEGNNPIFPLGTHVGYYMDNNTDICLVVLASNGKKVKFEQCFSAIVKGSILYGVEITENRISILTKRKLLAGPEIVSKPEFIVSLAGYDYPHIECVADNGNVVLSSSFVNNKIILVNTITRNVCYVDNPQHNYAINPVLGEVILYLYDKPTKVSPAGIAKLDFLPMKKNGWPPTLLHINREGHLYIITSPVSYVLDVVL